MNDTEEIKNLYHMVNKAMVKKDTQTLRQIVKPGSVLIYMTGYVQPISEWFSQIESKEMRYFASKEENIKDVAVNGQKAGLTGQSRAKARIWGGGTYTWPLQIKMSFEKQDGKWLVTDQLASTY